MEQKLSEKQFDLLVTIVQMGKRMSQRELSQKTGLALTTVNRTLRELKNAGYIFDGLPTMNGFSVLEHYRVKRAVFLAAGFGSRLVPITLNTPKPLVMVNGKRIIDGLLDACLSIGISEIYIVRGYLGKQFDALKDTYPSIRFIENPAFNETNNISSAFEARYLLENAYVFESDLLISNPNILSKYHYSSDFLSIPVERSDDWCFETSGNIIASEKLGGINCHQMVGISYWNEEDGRKLASDIEKAYHAPGGKELYWEQVPLDLFKDNYSVSVRECTFDDIIEIDTLRELRTVDTTYAL